MTDHNRVFRRVARTIYLAAVALILFQFALAYVDVRQGDYLELGTRALFIAAGGMIILSERRNQKGWKRKERARQLVENLDGDMRKPVVYVVMNLAEFSDSPAELDRWVASAAREFGVDEQRLKREIKALNADLEYIVRTGELPPDQ